MDMDIHEFNPICWVFLWFSHPFKLLFSSISNHKSSKILRKPLWGTDPRDLRAQLLELTMSTGPPEATMETPWPWLVFPWRSELTRFASDSSIESSSFYWWHVKIAFSIELQKNVGAIARSFPIRWIREKWTKIDRHPPTLSQRNRQLAFRRV